MHGSRVTLLSGYCETRAFVCEFASVFGGFLW